MTNTPANDNSPRPAEFDRRLVAYMPTLRKRAKYMDSANAEELVQDTVVAVLTRWKTFRNDGNYTNFSTWILWQLRATHTDRTLKAGRKKSRAEKKPVSIDDVAYSLPEAPRQEDIVYAGEVVSSLSRSRGGRMLLRLGKGELLREIGAKRGVSMERVRQLTDEAREKLKRRVAA